MESTISHVQALTVVATLCPAALPSESLTALVQDTWRFADADEATLLGGSLDPGPVPATTAALNMNMLCQAPEG